MSIKCYGPLVKDLFLGEQENQKMDFDLVPWVEYLRRTSTVWTLLIWSFQFKKKVREPSRFERAADIFKSKMSVWDFSKFRFVLKKRVLSQFSFSVPRVSQLEHPPFVTRGELPTLIFWLGLRNGSSGKRAKGQGVGMTRFGSDGVIEYCYIKKSFLLMLVKLVALFTCTRRELRTNTLSKFK